MQQGSLESLVLLAHEVCIETPSLLGPASGVAGMVLFGFYLGWERACLILSG